MFLFKEREEYVGFIWIEQTNEKQYKILSLYLEDAREYTELKRILYFLRPSHSVYYECRYNNKNKNALEKLGFVRKNHSIEMKYQLEDIKENILGDPEIEFKKFRENEDERKRWHVQNEVFKSDKRIPLSLNDIIDDEFQSYYIEDAGYFMVIKGKYIGYGQLIKHD